jgi:hypothetical protein
MKRYARRLLAVVRLRLFMFDPLLTTRSQAGQGEMGEGAG